MANSTRALQWEPFDGLTERAVISLQTRQHVRQGFLHLSVTEEPTTWAWKTEHITLSDHAAEVAQGTGAQRDHARQLAERAAEFRLDELRGQGVYGVPARD